jgi:ribosomal protein S18 acetylase RimI-like enzyme
LKITIELAKPEDARGVAEVFRAAWLDTYPNEAHNITRETIEERWKAHLADEAIAKRSESYSHPEEGVVYLVAKAGQKPVGICRAVRSEEENRITALYVHPEYHRQGIGRALWEAARRHLDVGKPTMLSAASYNERAIKFYESLGFAKTDKPVFFQERLKLPNGSVIPEIEMRRPAEVESKA